MAARSTSGLWLAGPVVCRAVGLVGLSVWSRTGDRKVCCSVLDRMALACLGSEGLNHFRPANDGPQNYPETG